ncbi:hypothetical protein CHS0354_008714 [Potamilus streckersoni]|uniref:Uncharacterized protein n=1 Tax=Potamilus streckersoni TaxID=2493646 RepID=A0AAE0VT07_9BIVA|nr:hypothetical protein CHS0354_008714 [Potamilus streckersoni]
MSYFRPFIVSVGTGMFVVGIGGAVIYRYMRLANAVEQSLNRFSATLGELKAEILQLEEKVDALKFGSRNSGFYSIHPSTSGDDDDDAYVEAYSGNEIDQDEAFHISLPAQQEQGMLISTEEFFDKVDKCFDGTDGDKLEAYNLLQNNRTNFETDAEFHWRFAKATYQVAQIEGGRGNAERKKEMVYSAKDLAEKAVNLQDNCANAHKWYAITIGSLGDYVSTQEKIKNGYAYKEHIEKAIGLNPKDPSNHYLLGRWCYGVYMLSWLERKAASALYATPPSSTAEEALACFLEADRLNPGKWKENLLYIGKCYIELKKHPEAVEWLRKAESLPVVGQDDKESQEELKGLLAKYGSDG